MATTPESADLTKWLIALLASDPADYPIGDSGAPASDDGGVPAYPYWSVWEIPGGSIGGPPLGAQQADATLIYQIDSVGLTVEQSRRLRTRARDLVSGRTAAGVYATPRANPSGMVVTDRVIYGTPGAPAPEGKAPNEVWTTSERFAISVSAGT